MEYVFRNSIAESPATASLGQFSMVLKDGDSERTISYAAISSIQLFKKGDFFFIQITPESGHAIKISNRFYHSADRYDDYSNAYGSFVRILHHHLKEKSEAKYHCGIKPINLWISIIMIASASLITTISLDFAKIQLIDKWIQAGVIFTLFSMVYLLSMKDRFPRSYEPENIPQQFLPQQGMFA